MGGVETRLRPGQDVIKSGGDGMKYLKRLRDMTHTKRGTCTLIAASCIPLTLYNVLIISPSLTWSAAMVRLNVLMFVIAAGETDE